MFKFQSYNLQLITFPKSYLASKSIHWDRRYLQFCVKKRMKLEEKAMWILVDFTRFLTLSCRYLKIAFWRVIKELWINWIGSSNKPSWHKMDVKWILNFFYSVLETLWVAHYMIEIWTQNLLNFIVKFGSKAEICWKLEELKCILLNNSEVSSYLLGHLDMWLKVKIVPDSWKWIRFWKFGPYWVQKYLFHQNRWCQTKPRPRFPRHLSYRTILH